jgi:hypothetical protein
MASDEFDARVRDSFQCSPGQNADGAGWLPIDDPELLASLIRQQALEQFWFGVQRNHQGQMLGMDICLLAYRSISSALTQP